MKDKNINLRVAVSQAGHEYIIRIKIFQEIFFSMVINSIVVAINYHKLPLE